MTKLADISLFLVTGVISFDSNWSREGGAESCFPTASGVTVSTVGLGAAIVFALLTPLVLHRPP